MTKKTESDAIAGDATLGATLSASKRCTKEAVAARLKQFRKATGLTQPAAALKAGEMPLPSFKDYEAGNRLPGAEALAALALLGLNVNWLLTGEGDMRLQSGPPRLINAAALSSILAGVLKEAPNLPAERIAALVAEFYVKMVLEGGIESDAAGTVKNPEAA